MKDMLWFIGKADAEGCGERCSNGVNDGVGESYRCEERRGEDIL
jgi:hypothetical protein